PRERLVEDRLPLTAARGAPQGHVRRNPEDAADAVRTIQSNASHLLTIINDILDVSKIEAEQMTVESIDTNPVQIVEEIASLIRPRAQGKGVDVRVRYDSPIPTVIQSDPTRVRQILLNLVGNAIKFTEMGSVTIRMSCDVEARSLRLCVVDTGIGMSREQRLSIARFEAFNQADASMTRKFGGSGLGLRISNALAKMLGGGIEIESIEGQGSTFIVSIGTGDLTGTTMLNPESTLTIGTESGGTDSCKRTNDSLGRPLEGLAILLAEDGPDNQRLISFHLKRAGADVTVCDNGAIAVTTINEASCSKRPHVVLMDMQMPELDGYGATRRLRQDGHTMPIIALTAHAMEGDRQKCLEAGCDDYLSKPIDRDELIAVCARHGCKAPLTTVLAGSPGNPSGRA
ncbi:MAG: response regulator, partial [Phycisphaerae bacterium]